MHTQESGKGMKKLRNNKIRKLLAFMVALALMVSCMPSAYTISASEAFGDGTEDIFTDGEITSEPAAEESTPDVSSADQEETEQAQQSTLTYENDSVKVTAEALEDGALPQNTALKADGVNENSSVSYDTVSQKLSAAATDKGSSLRGFFAYDVYFADGDGNRVEPNGRVRVTFEYKTPAAPELTDAASTSVTVEKLHYNSSTGDTDVNTLQANEDLKVLNVNEGKQIQTLQVETGNAAVFAVMWDSPETADVEAEAVSGNEDEVPIASEELTDGMDISDEPEQDAAETPAAENPEVTPEAEPSEAPAENPDAEPTEAPAEDPDVVEEPAEDIASPEDVPAADENGETSLIEVLGDDTNLRVSPSIEAEVLVTVNAGTQLTLLDTVTAEDGATWYKVSWEGTEAYIRSDMAQVVDSSDEAEEVEDVQEEEIQPEITRYDYTSDEVNVKVTLTDPADLPDNAELSVTPVELSQEAEDQITEEAIKEKKAIEKIHAYDIKFLVDGEEVQPGATVKVSVSLNDEKKSKDADVYHVDENDNVENMDGSVAKNGDVEFETTHFSTYVIVNNSPSRKVKVTLQHYCNNIRIYADTVRHIEVGGKIPDYRATENYNIEKVEVVKEGEGEKPQVLDKDKYEVRVASDTVVKIYYTPKQSTESGDVVFYDYQVSPGNGKRGINDISHYQKRDKNNMMIMGTQKQTGLENYNALGDNNKNANIYDENDKWGATTGLVTGLSNDYKKVVWKVDQPGFFTDAKLGEGKEKYTDYKLVFSKTGNNYKLTRVKQPGDNSFFNCKEDGSEFFPLKNPIDDQTQGGKYYFGMRYDIEFKLGDYVGPLNYTFTGDDDLWVLLDGKKVVIDVGGIHKSIERSTDLWNDLGFKEGIGAPTDEEKNKTHRITVLYMERGAYESNCKMDFTIPDARFVNVENVPLADLTLTKVDSKGKGISGAKFKLVNDNGGETYPITTSDDKGSVIFNNLKEGTYTLTETMAPNGYEASQESWIVKVTSSDDKKAVATLYKADGTTKIEKDPDSSYHIMNYTQEEIIKASMDYSKTATVNDWDKRTYDINISAASTSTSTITTTEKAVADIMLVLDVSGSMDEIIKTTEDYRYVADNTDDGRNKLATSRTYYMKINDSYKAMSYGELSKRWYIDWKQASDYPTNYKIYTNQISRLDALKNSVDQFITDTASKSSDSKIGITAFSSNGYGDNGKNIDLQEAKSGENSLKDFTNKLKANGGTDPKVGLNDAKNKLDTLKDDGRPKYVILFTDGMPTGSGNTWSPTAQKAAETSATALKTAGYTVYTIGYGFDDNSNEAKFLAGDGTKNYPGIASTNCAFTANDATKLGEIFRDIQNTITQDIEITGAKVTDVIDSRFDLLDKNGSPIVLEEGGTANAYGGTVSLVNGCYQIQWTDQTIPNKKNGEWNKKIKVKAKDNFVGGNNVTTNVSPGSKISTGYGAVDLPQPTVNVKVNLVVKDKDVWIYKGDPVPTNDEILNQLFSESETSYSEGTISAADAKDHVTLQWFKKDKDGKRINISKEKMATTPDDYTEYYLEVTYDPKTTSTDKSKTNTTTSDGEQHVVGDTEKAYNPDNSNPYGIYKIHVIKGQIQITKNVTEESATDRTFTFTMNEKIGNKVSESKVNVIVPANEKRGTATLSNLPRGEYTVTEDNADGYSIQAFNIVTGDGQTDCENSKSDTSSETKSLTFVLGNDTKRNNVIHVSVDKKNYTYDSKFGGVKGVASYTNEAVTSLDLKKTDTDNHSLTGAKFKLEMKDGNIWKSLENDIEVKNGPSEIELNNLKTGIYKLTETTAPKGYSLLGSSIYFKVETGNVTLVDENGDPAEASNMWSLKAENKVLTIKNAKLYSLPESGGPGTYGFTISGVAILATALLLFINNKRREEEAKRS